MAARTLITTYQAVPASVSWLAGTGDVTNGMKVVPARQMCLIVTNNDSSSHNVTVLLPPPPDAADATDRVIAVPAGGIRVIGPFPGDYYTQPTAADPNDIGFIHVNVDSTLLSVGAVRL